MGLTRENRYIRVDIWFRGVARDFFEVPVAHRKSDSVESASLHEIEIFLGVESLPVVLENITDSKISALLTETVLVDDACFLAPLEQVGRDPTLKNK